MWRLIKNMPMISNKKNEYGRITSTNMIGSIEEVIYNPLPAARLGKNRHIKTYRA